MSLEPIEPQTALEFYLQDKENELAEASLRSHRYRLGHFIQWCEQNDIDNLNDLTGRQIHQFRVWRVDDGELSKASEKTQMDTLRVFVRFCESIDAVPQDLSTKVRSPSLSPNENTRDVMVDSDTAEQILAHLNKYAYASRPHVVILLFWRTMMRISTAHSLDVGDYNSDEQYLDVRHRPDSGTPIKNKTDGERLIALSDEVCTVLDDWVQDRRPEVTDEYGRDPLLATQRGRPNKTTLRNYAYISTHPCQYGDECPHGRDTDECEALATRNDASKCPSSKSPHAFRRGSITRYLNEGVPDQVVSDRANVSPEVIDQHYDRRSQREKMEQRKEYLDDL